MIFPSLRQLNNERLVSASFLPGESQGQGSLVGCHLWGCTESDTTEVTEHTLREVSRGWGPGMLLDLRQARSSPHHKELTESKLSTALR